MTDKHGPVDWSLPWEGLFHALEPSPNLAPPSHNIFVLKKSNVDIGRLRSFISSFEHSLVSAAQQERSRYPETLKLRKLYSKIQEEDIPVIVCSCIDCFGYGNTPKYNALAKIDSDNWENEKEVEVSGRYIQHFLQEEDVKSLLFLAIVDAKCSAADSHDCWGPSGYGFRTKLMYLELFIYTSFLLSQPVEARNSLDLYTHMKTLAIAETRMEECIIFDSVKCHQIYKLLEANPTLNDPEKTEEILHLIARQLCLYQLFSMETDSNPNWETAFINFLYWRAVPESDRFCEDCDYDSRTCKNIADRISWDTIAEPQFYCPSCWKQTLQHHNNERSL